MLAAVPTASLCRGDLTPEQHAAATHPAGGSSLLIVAGAGTGKTHTLAARLAFLLRQGVAPHQVLLMSFSRRAAAELERRAGQRVLQELGLARGTPPPRLPWCGTFHSIAARLLREDAPVLGIAAGFTVLDRADSQDLLALARQQLGLAETGGARRFPLPATCAAIHSRQVNTGLPLAELLREHYPWCSEHEATLQRLFEAWQAAKVAQGALDYDDLLVGWWRLMQDEAAAARIAARWRHVLVDEVQDINQLQSELLHALQRRGVVLTAVGDDAQAIYAFRGASVRHILALPARCTPPAQVLTLTQSHRSTPELLAASNAVIAGAAERFPKALWSRRAAGLKPRIVVAEDESAEAEGVADAVLAARERGIALRRQAVLFRTASHSLVLELTLARRGVPFVKFGGLRFLESAHVKDFLALLRWADNPALTLAAHRVARLVPGFGPAAAARLAAHRGELRGFKAPPGSAVVWAGLVGLIEGLRAAPRWPGELGAVLEWMAPQLERQHDDAPARMADLRQLAALAPAHRSREAFVTAVALEPPEASSDESGPPHLDEDYLILSTLHSAKGQEWNAVHLLHMSDGCMPADLATGSASAVEEERRVLYVGMTRAKDELTLWVPQRFHVTQQRAFGSRHLYALRTRFVPDELLTHFETAAAAC